MKRQRAALCGAKDKYEWQYGYNNLGMTEKGSDLDYGDLDYGDGDFSNAFLRVRKAKVMVTTEEGSDYGDAPIKAEQEPVDLFECRICRMEEEDVNQLIAPCACTGSMIYVHKKCLDTWRATSPSRLKACGVCHAVYREGNTKEVKMCTVPARTDGIYIRDREGVGGPFSPEDFERMRRYGRLEEINPKAVWRKAGGHTYIISIEREYSKFFTMHALGQLLLFVYGTFISGLLALVFTTKVDLGPQGGGDPDEPREKTLMQFIMPGLGYGLFFVQVWSVRNMYISWRNAASELVGHEN